MIRRPLQIFHTVIFAAVPTGGNPCPVVLDADGLTPVRCAWWPSRTAFGGMR